VTTSVVFTVIAAVCFLLALVIALFGTLDPEAAQALLFGGLAAFALGHIPWQR